MVQKIVRIETNQVCKVLQICTLTVQTQFIINVYTVVCYNVNEFQFIKIASKNMSF